MNILRIATCIAFLLTHTLSLAVPAQFWRIAAGTNCKSAIQSPNIGASRKILQRTTLLILDPCLRFGKLSSAAADVSTNLFENSFEQDTLVHTRVLTDSGYQKKLKTIKDIQVGDEVLAWDELQAHDNAALAPSGQAVQTLQAAYQQANFNEKSAPSPINISASSYENKSVLNPFA